MNVIDRDAREAVGLIAQRELRVRLRSKAFRITLAVLVLMVIGLNIALHVAHSGGPSVARIGLPPQDASLSAPLEATGSAAGQHVATVAVPDPASGRNDVRAGRLTAFVEDGPHGLAVTVDKSLDPALRSVLASVVREQALYRSISRLGGDPAQVVRAEAAAVVQVTSLQPPTPQRDKQRLILAVVAGLLLYGTFMMCGPLIAQGVVEEKSSRVVELLLATVRPWQLMVGKVLGTGALGLIQIVVVGGAGLISADLAHTLSLPLSGSLSTLAWALVWFLAGFALFSLLFAAAGSLVSRQEDLGGVQFPVLMPIIIAWVLGISTLPAHPDNGLVAALSLVPFFAPVLMPMRIALGTAAVWQEFTALGLTLLLAFLMVRLASRIYRNSVLRSGARVTWREALHAA